MVSCGSFRSFEAGKATETKPDPMWPWGHLAVGYLLYAGFTRWRFDRSPQGGATLAVLFGTQFPDLVDKPLAWTFHLLPSGRSLAHSLLTATLVCVLVWLFVRWHGHSILGTGFAIGYVSHLFADALSPVLAGEYRYVSYLGWPVLDQPSYDTSMGFAAQFAGISLTPLFVLQLVLGAFAIALWFRDGCPGLAILRGWLGSWRGTVEH